MYFNRKNAEQKNWRMIKKGKHFLFGCSLVFAVGAALVAPSVKADAVDAKPEASSTTEGIKPVAAEENATYAAPAVEVAPSTPVAPATVVAEEKAVVVENTTAKTANKEALTQLVEEVKVLDKAGKTEDSLARLNTALDQAQKVLDNAEASQEQVDAALASLKDAVAQLAAKEEKAATVATEEKTEVKEAEAAVAETEVARPRGKRAANRSIDGSLGTGEFTGEGVKQFESVRYSVDGDKTTWTIEVVPEKASNTFAGLAVTSDDTISSIRMIGKSGKFGNNLKDQYLDLPKRPDNMPFANYKVHMSEFRTIGGGIPDNIVYEVVTNGKNHNLFGRFATALVESSLKNNGLNGKSVIGARTSDFPTVGVSLKSKLPAETPKPQPQPETPKPVTPTTQAPEITSNLSGKASTPADVTVKAPAGSTVKLYNKDGVVIGEAVANDQGVATVHPTNSLPEGEITATSTPAGGSESAKSAPITVTKSPITESGLNRNGDAYTQLLLSKTHITVYPGDNVDIDVIGAASSYIKRFYPVNPNSVYGLFPDGIYFQTTGSQQHRQLNNKYHGTVHEKQPAGDFVTTFVLESKNGKVVSTPLKITVLESAKKYEPVAGAKVEVADVNNVSEAEKTKIIAAAKAANTSLPSSATYSVDEKGNLVITYADKSTDKISAAYLVTPAADTEAPAKPVVNTDLTGKAGTKTPVEVTAEKGSTVALYDKDGNKIGEATAGENGKATITPSVNIPAGAVTAKATDAAGNTSVASDPATATPAADTEAPAKPVVNTDLTGKAGTKTPVEVTAEKGSTVALYDKDNNKIGEATAGENGKATITPTVDIPAGAVTAKATDVAGNTSVASDPATATPPADTEAPAKPVVNTDLTGKAGTKTPVEVTAEKGSTVALYDKDNNKIGEATAGENGKATITPTVDIPAGAVTAKATDAAGNTSVASDPATATAPATVVAPTVEIPYSNKDKEVYVYAGEENSFDIKFKDDSGKIVSATVKQGGNREFGSVAGEADTINTQYGFKANVISTETPATATAPAVITYRGTPAATDGLKPEVLEAATKGENPKGMVLGWRYATATDADGAFIENKAVGSSTATDPGAFRVVLKAQSQKYDIATPTEKVTVADPANVTEAELGKIKEKLQLEYSKTNDDANLADKKGKAVADKDGKIQSVAKDADGNLVVTYTDGSQDKKPLSEFVTKAPTVELPYSNQEHKQIYVYTGENTDLTFKAADDTAVKDMYVRGPGGIGEDNTARYGFTTGKIENSAVTHGDGTVSGATATIKMTGVTTLKAPNRWTSFVVANDNDNAPSNTDFNALDKNPNATQTPGYVQFIVKSQTDKYDIATPAPADKVEVADPTNVTNDDLDKIKEKLQLEYNKKNDDANISKDSPVDKNGKIQSVTKDDQGNLVVTYTDGSKDTKPLTEFVTKKPTTPDTEAPAKPVVNTDLTGKAGTKTPVEVSAEPGSKVELFDKDGNKIGEGTADKNGKATVTPTVNIPEGNVTAKATDPSGNVSVPSDPAKATTPSTPDTEAPAKPVVDTDLTGKAGTKTPVVVSAEPGSKVELFDKDGNKIGEGTADKNGKATVTPTVNIPEGNVTAKATDPSGNVSVPSDPAKATTPSTPDTEAPAKPVVDTDLTGKAGTKTPVEVTADPGTKVELFDKDGNKIGEATAGTDGKATINPTVDIPAGNVTAKATKDGQPSDASTPKVATAATPAKPSTPVVNTDLTGKAGTKTPVEVTADPGTKVELFDKDGNKIGEATAGTDGKATINPTVDIPAGNVTAKATKDGQPSDASTPKVATAATPAKPSTPVVNTDLTGKAGTKTPVEVTADPGTKVELFDKDGNKIGEATAGTDGKATINPTVDIPAGNVTAKATKDGQPSDASTPKVATAATPAKPSTPVVNTDLTGKAGTKTPVEVTADPGTKVELFDKDGNKIGEATAGTDGKATINPTVDIPAGNVTAKATKDGQPSDASTPKVATAATPAKPSTPVVNTDLTGKAGTKTPVEVTADPGTKVELFDKDGNKIGEATAGTDGKATINPTVDIPAGNVTAKATKDGQPSDASTPKVATAATPAKPSTPVVNTDLTGKAGTKTPVEVTADPGTKVELFDKDGNKIGEATAGTDGKATITPTVDIPAGNVTAKATKDGQPSDASAPKVATAATPAKPSTPVVNTDLTGKAGTKTPVEVTADPGTKVELFDKDGNKIGEATAGTDGKATINPTVDIPAGNVTAKATKDGQPSDASTPKVATAATPAKPSTPVVNTDLTGKAGTKTPVEVTADPGTKVELFDKDGNKIGEATAGTDGKATINPTVDIPAGNVTAKATKDGQPSDASAPKVATAATPAKPSTPVVNTDLTGKAGTKTPVEVTADPGTKVELFDKDGNKIGEATAGTDGKATINPTVDIPAGNVTAKATKDGQPSDASAPKVATAATPAKPSTPVVNTDLTGKAGTKTPVEVTADPGTKVELFDKDGNKIGEATAGTDGKATINPTVDIPAGNVTAKATKDGQPSDASAPKVATAATPAKPSTPVVNTDLTGKAGTKTPVEVTADPGTKVELFDKDGNKIGEATAGTDGKATINPTVDIPAGNVTAKATKDGQPSDASAPKVATAATPAKPSTPVVNTDLTGKAGTKTPVEVTADPGTKVELFDKDGNKIGEATAGTDGKATINPTVDIPAGNVTAKATKDGQPSDASAPKVATAATPAKPSTPVVNTDLTGKAGTKTPVEVTADPGTKVELFDKDGNKIGEATAGTDGKATITPTVDIPAGNVTAKATKDGQPSDASTPKVATAATPAKPSTPVVNTDLTGKAGTKTPVEVTADPGTKVELFDKDGNKIGEATAGTDGKATINPTVDIPAGNVTAKATKDGQPSDASAPKVATAATPAKPSTPVVNTDLTGKAGTKTPVEVTADPGTKVELFDKDGNKIGEATAGTDGKATITPTVDIPAGNVTAKATKDGQPSDASAPKVATAATPAKPSTPVVNTDLTGKAGTKTPVEVTADPGTKVELFDKDGNKIGEATAGTDGKATINPTVDIPAGNVTAKATKDGQPSDASAPKVATAATPAKPSTPVVNTDLTGKAGTKTPVEVTADPGTKVELFDKDGNKIGEATAGTDGKATITPTVDIPAGNVTAKATDPSGNVSEPSEPAKATTPSTPDTEAPAKPEVKTDLTGKAGTKTPVEVNAEPGSKVELFDKDGNKIGEATAGTDGKATITPTVAIPEGNVTAKATDPSGNVSEPSEPAKATPVKTPAVTPVVNPSALTDAEKAKVADEVKKANPTASKVEVGNDGTATVTFPDGSKATLTPEKTVKEADSNGVKTPAVTPVVNPSALTDAEKAKVADEVKKANPTASKVEVGNDGTATVTFPDGSKATLTPEKTVKEADSNGVKTPAVTPVVNPSALTDAEKAKVADEVKKANPTASKVEVGNDGTATVTFPDGSTASLTPAQTVKEADSNGVKTPAVTPVVNPSALTDAEKAKVADEVKKANPTASKVEVGNDGTATVTFPDGSKASLTPAQTVKEADKELKDPAVTPVTDPSNLTDAEKAKVAEEVKKANPTVTDVKVGEDGTTTVTYPGGTTAVIPAEKTVKKSADKELNDPAVTPVTDPSDLTDAEKTKVADEVKKANPSVTDVTVGNDGAATVTYPDGTTAVIPAEKTVKKSDDKDVKDPAITPVADPSNLTDAEKTKVADEVKKANPSVTDVTVGNDGTATVTYPDGKTAVIPAEKTVKKSDDKVIKDPAVTPVVNPSTLTDAEKAKVADEVKKANPSVTDVTVGNDGTATVTYPDGTTAVIPAEKTVKKSDDKVIKVPAVTPVVNPSALTDAEKAKVADEVKKANPTASKVEVGNDGTATVTFPDGSTASLTPAQTVKEADSNGVKTPAVTPVVNPSALTDAEKAKVADEVKKANPTASKVEVGNDGTATVTFPDGSTASLTPEKTVKEADSNGVKTPAVTPVVNPSALTDAEKAKVADEVKKANPTASKVEVGNDGTATVTFPDGSKATLTPEKTVKEADSNGVKTPAVTPVVNPSALTDAEKAKVAEEVKKANPTASKVEVGNDGTATVTFPDGSKASLTPAQTVKEADKELKDPAVTPVTDPSNLTDAEKAKVAEEVKKANPTVTDVTVGNDGTTTVTYPGGTTAVIPAEKTVKKSADKELNDPAVTPVTDPSDLTDAEKTKVADEVKKANPSVTDVTVGNDGAATVTYPDGTTAVIPAEKTVKKSDDKDVKDPAITPVVNPSALTDSEKAKVAEEVKKANPSVTDVTVGNDGTATVTYPDGKTAVIPAEKTVKKSDDKVIKDPAVTPVVNPSALTDAEKAKVADEVKKANPSVTDVTVGNDGTATVTYPDGTTAVIPAEKTVKKSADKVIKVPAITPVVNPSALTDAEKAKVADEVKKANPTASKVEVGNDGTATVTFPDGSKATLTPAQTVKEADSNGVKTPAVTPVANPSSLTDAEKAKVADEVKKSNPTATDVKVGEDGTTTVTFPDGSKATLTPAQTVKEADSTGVKTPAVTPVANPSSLTDAEKAKVADEVKKANPTASKVEVGNDGTATVTFPDGSKAVLTPAQTVKEADSTGVKTPAVTPVVNPSALTDAEKAKVADEVKKANPTASKVEVGNDGTATVTFPDGSTAVLTPAQTVKEADSNGVKTPAVTPVVNPSALTDAEKAKVADEVKKANPTASKVEVGNDGSATVTFPDGSTAVLTPAQTVKEADSNGVKTPAVTPVVNPSALTDAEKAKVADEVKKSNPTATDVKVSEDGTVTVTFPDGSTASLTPAQTVKEADSNGVKTPAVTPVVNPSALTDAEKAKVADEVKKANPTATDVKVSEDGTVTVTFPDGSTAVIPADKTVKRSSDKAKESDGVKNPSVTPVTDPSNLTDAEKAKVAEEVKKANPTAKDIKVNNDGSVVVTFADGSVAVLASENVVKEATKESSAQAPAKKAGAKELPNTGTKQSNASLGLALLAAVTGGLLIAKKREEEE